MQTWTSFAHLQDERMMEQVRYCSKIMVAIEAKVLVSLHTTLPAYFYT